MKKWNSPRLKFRIDRNYHCRRRQCRDLSGKALYARGYDCYTVYLPVRPRRQGVVQTGVTGSNGGNNPSSESNWRETVSLEYVRSVQGTRSAPHSSPSCRSEHGLSILVIWCRVQRLEIKGCFMF